MNKSPFRLVPRIRVGAIFFGKPLTENLIERYELVHLTEEEEKSVGWSVWGTSTGTLRIYLESKLVVSVGCYSACQYRNKNLIGLSIIDVAQIFRTTPNLKLAENYEINGEIETTFDIERFGLQFWVRNEVIIAVVCD